MEDVLSCSPLTAYQSIPMLDFARQYADIRDEIIHAITVVCDSQNFILGPQVTSFEQSAALSCGTAHAIGCASGTDALWLALKATHIGAEDSVVTSPFTFFATASAILRCGATPVFADIDPTTFNLSAAAVESVLNSRAGEAAKAVLPVHLYGQCADWSALTDLKQQHPNLLLIEDAAQAFGATWRDHSGNDVPAGGLGDAAAFSFYPTKNLSAFGDAGLVTTRNAEFAERATMLRAHGMRRRYYHDEVGGNSRLDTLQAAILKVKLRYLPGWNRQRQLRASTYDRLFRAAGLAPDLLTLPMSDPRAGHVFHQYVVRAARRDDLRAFLSAREIGSEIYYPLPLHLQKSLAFLGYKRGDFPYAEQAATEVLALPLYPELREDEQTIVVQAIADFYT